MSGVELIEVKPQDDGMRLNRWFLKYYPDLPLSRLQKLLRTKQIKVDGAKVETSCKLVQGQVVRVPPLSDEKKASDRKEISEKDKKFALSLVIYKDDNIIVLNKPSGLAVQGGTNTKFHIDKLLPALCFDKDEQPKLVHRIDKETSGILVLARNRKNAEILTKAFKGHELQKTYLAILEGIPAKDNMVITAPLLKMGDKMAVAPQGQKATSNMEVLDKTGNKFAFVKLEPLSGRTHQLRVHMQYISAPILGDDKYGINKKTKFEEIADKLYLHAYKIDLSSIYKKLVITADLPDYFKDTLKFLGLKTKVKF